MMRCALLLQQLVFTELGAMETQANGSPCTFYDSLKDIVLLK